MSIISFTDFIKKEYIIYSDEMPDLMEKHELPQNIIDDFKKEKRYRWVENETLSFLFRYYPYADTSQNIPNFLLKENNG